MHMHAAIIRPEFSLCVCVPVFLSVSDTEGLGSPKFDLRNVKLLNI